MISVSGCERDAERWCWRRKRLQAKPRHKLAEGLERQPSWSDLPLILITAAGNTAREPTLHLDRARPGGEYLRHRAARPA